MITLPSVIVWCPPLNRDISVLQACVPNAEVFLAPRMAHGHDGCILAHQAIVQRAKAERWPAVFVMEDDCAFTDAFSLKQWRADVAWAAAHGYDIVTGGCVSTRNARVVRDGLCAVDRFKSTHCVAYLPAAYDIVLTIAEPIDVNLGRRGGKPLVTVPYVAVQRPGYSGIQNCDVDYRPMYARHEAHLRTLCVGAMPC